MTTEIAMAAATGSVIGSLVGALAAIYARGRADGKRDEVIERHEKRLDDGTQKMAALNVTATASDKALAVLETKVDAITSTVEEVREIVRDLSKRR